MISTTQTNAASWQHAPLPLWWRYLYNCTSTTCCRGVAKQWAASCQYIVTPSVLPTAADCRQLNFIQLEMPLGNKAKAAWQLRAVTLKQRAHITQYRCDYYKLEYLWGSYEGTLLLWQELCACRSFIVPLEVLTTLSSHSGTALHESNIAGQGESRCIVSPVWNLGRYYRNCSKFRKVQE